MQHLSKFVLLLILLPMFVLSCADGTYVRLNVEASSAPLIGVTRLDISAQLGGQSSHTALEPGGEIGFPTAITLDLGSKAGTLVVLVSAKNQAAREVASGSGSVEAMSGMTTSLTVQLGPATQLEISPTSQDLGLVSPGGAAEAVFQVRNVGELPTGGLSVTLQGEDFVLTSNGCMGSLPAGWSCTVKVQFQPRTTGGKVGKLAVSANPGGTATATLSGIGNQYIWAKRFGGTSTHELGGIAVDSSGNVLLVGDFRGIADFGGEILTSAGQSDIYLVKYRADGTNLWSKRFGGGSVDAGFAIAVDRGDNVLIAAGVRGGIDFGGGLLTGLGGQDAAVAKFDANGTHLWSKCMGGSGNDLASTITTDSSGNVLVAGEFAGTASFGGAALTSIGSSDLFMARYDANGTHIWSKRLGGTASEYSLAMTLNVDSRGNLLLAGGFFDTIDLGGAVLTSAGSYDVFTAKYDAAGAHLWSNRFGGSGDETVIGAAVDGSGGLQVAGYFSGTTDLGGGVLTSAGGTDMFVARYNAAGAHLWSKRLGGVNSETLRAVAVDSRGNLLVAGDFSGTADFGGGTLTSAGGNDLVVAKYDASGAYLWSRSFGGSDNGDSPEVLAVDGSGNVLVSGSFFGTVDFGGGLLSSSGGYDHFLLKLAP